jgi:hypothetical protein
MPARKSRPSKGRFASLKVLFNFESGVLRFAGFIEREPGVFASNPIRDLLRADVVAVDNRSSRPRDSSPRLTLIQGGHHE